MSEWEFDCISDRFGTKYRGHINESRFGKSCLPWADVLNQTNLAQEFADTNATIRFDALNETAETAENYCRNPFYEPKNEPFCAVEINKVKAFDGLEACDIPECPMGKITLKILYFCFVISFCKVPKTYLK